MARFVTKTIRDALITSLASASFTSFELVRIFKGFDPRRLMENSEFPFAVVSMRSSSTGEGQIGGSLLGLHRCSITVFCKYSENQEPDDFRLDIGKELYDWLCDNKVSAGVYLVSFDAFTGGAPTIDYSPQEEQLFQYQDLVIAVRIDFSIQQPSYFNLNA